MPKTASEMNRRLDADVANVARKMAKKRAKDDYSLTVIVQSASDRLSVTVNAKERARGSIAHALGEHPKDLNILFGGVEVRKGASFFDLGAQDGARFMTTFKETKYVTPAVRKEWERKLKNPPKVSEMEPILPLHDPVTYRSSETRQPGNLQHAPPEVKADKELVLLAMKQRGADLQFASRALRDNEAVVKAACNDGKDGFFQPPSNLQYASDRIRDDTTFLLALYNEGQWSSDGSWMEWASPRLRDDLDFFLTIIPITNWEVIRCASKRLRGDARLFRAVFDANRGLKAGDEGKVMEYCTSEALKRMPEFYNAIPEDSDQDIYDSW